jgi:hypothetical protein
MPHVRSSLLAAACALALCAALPIGCGDSVSGTGGTGGTGTTSSSTTTATSSSSSGGGTGGGMVCTPGSTQPCYSGPAGTKDVGICKSGTQTCAADGSGFGACTGEVLPAPAEDCATPEDDDCNGTANEASAGCVCDPGTTAPCYEGPAGTENLGICKGGTKTCAADGKSYGACTGQVLPEPKEDCSTQLDENCNGMVDDGCPCVLDTMQSCYTGAPSTLNVGPCHAGVQTCTATGWGPCMGEVLPQPETCNTPEDDNCNGQVNEGGAGCVCPPNQMVACYSGPAGTAGVGICKSGLAQCNAQGTAMGPCMGEVLPQTETCTTPEDDDCNGQVNESGTGCVCLPNSTQSCYSGPAGTQGIGICKAGTRTCNAQGTAYGACTGEVLPAATDSCSNNTDDNCDGQVNEGCPVTYAANVKPILAAHCAPCHTQFMSGGANFASSYADSQLNSYYCPGKTKGACTIVRIKEGSMPQGAGCTGNPATDAGNAACLSAAEQSIIQAWIAGGQLP